jgi:hypothetical protein
MTVQSTTTVRGWWKIYRCSARTDTRLNDPGFLMWGKEVGGVPIAAKPAFEALEMALTAVGYLPVRGHWVERLCSQGGIGGQTCQSSGAGCSLHNYRVAIDIEPTLNPQSPGLPFAGKIQLGDVGAVTGIRNVYGEQMWSWGGYWSIPDRMHFQINVPPSRTQVDWTTVKGHPSNNESEEEDSVFDPVITKDASPAAIGYMQVLLEKAGLGVDIRASDGAGVWGKATEAAVAQIGNNNQALEGQEHANLILLATLRQSDGLSDRVKKVEAELPAMRTAFSGFQSRLQQVESSAANSAGAAAQALSTAQIATVEVAALEDRIDALPTAPGGSDGLAVGDRLTVVIESKED